MKNIQMLYALAKPILPPFRTQTSTEQVLKIYIQSNTFSYDKYFKRP
jgi:hypothetical protein